MIEAVEIGGWEVGRGRRELLEQNKELRKRRDGERRDEERRGEERRWYRMKVIIHIISATITEG